MKYAIVNSGVVRNIIEWDGSSEYDVDGVLVEADANAKIGGSWDGNVFSFIDPKPQPDTRTYAEKRRDAYPLIGDQLDMMYHDQTEGSRTWLDAIEAVKEAYPK
tara:strand:+ start:624 stop:935 length:312 start_codon:yes stop_codon:yes gene_type:complete